VQRYERSTGSHSGANVFVSSAIEAPHDFALRARIEIPKHMHACAWQYMVNDMRTTVEINDEHRARLLQIAARRGDKGFSRIIAEAIERYLAEIERSEAARRKALRLYGSLSRREADRLRADSVRIRQSWR
jgi:predicted DNA-binding protein